ncbi:MAG: flagellar hook-basal body complex protein FliE [Candidatus Poribacteria bacterium]|nr:MAG: flagellar hook-basal body complex protein FliE [Candidatus Poribacteria bacterium]
MVPNNPMTIRPLPVREGQGRLQELPREIEPSKGRAVAEEGGRSFLETLEASIQEVNRLQQEADRAIQDLVTGESSDVAQTMIAVQKASLSFQLMTQVRNKIVQAYEEVMRMPV